MSSGSTDNASVQPVFDDDDVSDYDSLSSFYSSDEEEAGVAELPASFMCAVRDMEAAQIEDTGTCSVVVVFTR
jgi:hypothetical protein